MQRVRMQDQGEGSVALLGVVITTFEPAIGTGEHHLGHGNSETCFLSSSTHAAVALLTMVGMPSPSAS